MLTGQHCENTAEVGALAQNHRIRQADVEQQPADAGVGADDADQVGDACAGLFGRWRRCDGSLCGACDVGDGGIENGGHELVLVGEALVEVPSGQARPSANRADSEDTVWIIGTEKIEPRVQKSASALVYALGRLYSAI